MNLKELYQEIILEHGKNPRNLKKIEFLMAIYLINMKLEQWLQLKL